MTIKGAEKLLRAGRQIAREPGGSEIQPTPAGKAKRSDTADRLQSVLSDLDDIKARLDTELGKSAA